MNKLRRIFIILQNRIFIKRIYRKYSEYRLIICYGVGIGDFCFSIAYLNHFKNQSPKKNMLLVSENLKNVIEFFSGYDKVVYVNKKKMMDMQYLLTKKIRWGWFEKKFRKKQILYTNPWVYRCGIDSQETVLEIMRKTIFQLEEDSVCQYPYIESESTNLRLEPGNNVLVNVDSNSTTIHSSALEIVVEFFISRGFTVYTNCINEEAACFHGTQKFVADLEELYKCANNFKYIVSVRSGIVDFLASKKVKFILLYAHNGYLPLYTMKQWPGVDALEMYYDDPDLMEKIEEYVEGRNEN